MSDNDFMKLALSHAMIAYEEGNLPIGSVLVINNSFVGAHHNQQNTNYDYFSHAESRLIGAFAPQFREAYRNKDKVELFTTVEPCMMCLGTAVHNRISRIVYGCPDPVAGASKITPPSPWYAERWPKITGNVLRGESYDLYIQFMKENLGLWRDTLKAFEEMGRQ